METMVKGNCYICGVELGKTAMKNHILKVHGGDGTQECRLLKIEGAFNKDYWLFIDVPIEKSLYDVDSFLRRIWLECCDHLSAFCSPERSVYRKFDMNRKLKTFSIGDKVIHEYDFGSTTKTLMTVMGNIKRQPYKEVVRLLARNVAPIFRCNKCDATAEYLCMEYIYNSDNPFMCGACVECLDYEDMLLPVTNSPRMGVCGYEGELDTFAFSLNKIED